MEEYSSREKVLKNVRNAGIHQAKCPFSEIDFSQNVFKVSDDSLDVAFAKAFVAIAGKFVYCADKKEFVESISSFAKENKWDNMYCLEPSLQSLLVEAEVPFSSDPDTLTEAVQGITSCEYLISRLGSIMVSSVQASGRRLVVYPDVHIVKGIRIPLPKLYRELLPANT